MGSYDAVSKALSEGRDPAMLCTTCPWDRMCVTPPTMTKGDVDAKIAEARRIDEDRLRAATTAGFGVRPDLSDQIPVATLATAMQFAGKDTAAMVCPVFALRLRSSGGRGIADNLKTAMQAWDDAS